MITPDDLLFSYRWGAETFRGLVADVADEQFTEQPIATINHPAWLLGHVSIYNEVIASLLLGKPFDNPWDAPCGKTTHPTGARSDYASKEAIVGRFDEGFASAVAAFGDASSGAWSAPLEHPTWGKQFATVAPAVTFLATTHLALHLGQLSGWRRAMKLPRIG